MDLKTLYQAQLFAPAFLFQSALEFWGAFIEPPAQPTARAPLTIDPAPVGLAPANAAGVTVAPPATARVLEAA